MIVLEVVDLSLDSLRPHSASYLNPVVRSHPHHHWQVAYRLLSRHISDGTAAMTKTTINYPVK